MSVRLSTVNASLVDFTVGLAKDVSCEDAKGVIKEAADGSLKRIKLLTLLRIEDDIVSTDILTNYRLSTLDTKAGIALNKNFVKTMGWHDNEYGYSRCVVDSTAVFANNDAGQ
ncbi:hypothetical protein ACHAQJ_004761 [Trichoderma viride]